MRKYNSASMPLPFLGYLLLLIVQLTSTQGNRLSAPAVRPHFAAVVVSNLDAASEWYKRLLNLKLKSEMKDDAGTYRIVILTSPEFELELLSLKGSVPRTNCLSGQPAGTEMQGLFKTGFDVDHMDQWIARLKSINIPIPQIWTDKSTGKRNFIITDPDKNMVQFFER